MKLLAVALIAGAAAAPSPSRLLVTADEFSLVLSRQSVAPGQAIIDFRNAGEDGHDLRMRRVRTKRVIALDEVPSLELARLDARLRKGRWKLWCSLPGHRKAGMRATLRVR